MGEAPKYAIRPKTALTTRGDAPGPGQYNPAVLDVLRRPPSAVIGKESRNTDALERKRFPGPGAYSLNTTGSVGPAYSFSTAKKQQKQRNAPGPGSYKIPCTFANVPNYVLPSKSQDFTYV